MGPVDYQNAHTFQSFAGIMVRTNPATAGRLHAYYNQPPETRQAMRGNTNPSYEIRLNAFQNRKILPERGMKLDEIPDHRTVEIAMERGWLNYVRQPEPYDAELVREFYAAMIPGVFDEFFAVRVRGRTVRMSMDDICLHYGVQRPLNVGLSYGIQPIPGVAQTATHSPVIAGSLRRNNRIEWKPKQNEILKSELPASLGLWFTFLKANLTPSSHLTNVDSYCGRILYCIQHNLALDIGHIIQLWMVDAAAESSTGYLPFPCLITTFCRDAGIPVHATFPPQSIIDRHTYRAHLTAMHTLDAKRASEREEVDFPEDVDDVDADDVDYDPHAEAGGQQDLPSDIPGLAAWMNAEFASLRQEVRTGFADIRREMRGEPRPDDAGPSQGRQQRNTRGRQSGASSSRRRARDD